MLNPKGLLTKVLSSSAINMVNDEVLKVYQKCVLHPLNRSLINEGNYLTLTSAQRFEVGQRAAEHGITAAALGCFNKKLQVV